MCACVCVCKIERRNWRCCAHIFPESQKIVHENYAPVNFYTSLVIVGSDENISQVKLTSTHFKYITFLSTFSIGFTPVQRISHQISVPTIKYKPNHPWSFWFDRNYCLILFSLAWSVYLMSLPCDIIVVVLISHSHN